MLLLTLDLNSQPRGTMVEGGRKGIWERNIGEGLEFTRNTDQAPVVSPAYPQVLHLGIQPTPDRKYSEKSYIVADVYCS